MLDFYGSKTIKFIPRTCVNRWFGAHQVLEIVAEPDAPKTSIEELLARQPTEITQAERLERKAKEDALRAELETASAKVSEGTGSCTTWQRVLQSF